MSPRRDWQRSRLVYFRSRLDLYAPGDPGNSGSTAPPGEANPASRSVPVYGVQYMPIGSDIDDMFGCTLVSVAETDTRQESQSF